MRADPAHEALRELEHRLLGRGSCNPLTAEASHVWVNVATYLDGRVQGTPEQKPGRKPDMSAPAAASYTENVVPAMGSQMSASSSIGV